MVERRCAELTEQYRKRGDRARMAKVKEFKPKIIAFRGVGRARMFTNMLQQLSVPAARDHEMTVAVRLLCKALDTGLTLLQCRAMNIYLHAVLLANSDVAYSVSDGPYGQRQDTTDFTNFSEALHFFNTASAGGLDYAKKNFIAGEI